MWKRHFPDRCLRSDTGLSVLEVDVEGMTRRAASPKIIWCACRYICYAVPDHVDLMHCIRRSRGSRVKSLFVGRAGDPRIPVARFEGARTEIGNIKIWLDLQDALC